MERNLRGLLICRFAFVFAFGLPLPPPPFPPLSLFIRSVSVSFLLTQNECPRISSYLFPNLNSKPFNQNSSFQTFR